MLKVGIFELISILADVAVGPVEVHAGSVPRLHGRSRLEREGAGGRKSSVGAQEPTHKHPAGDVGHGNASAEEDGLVAGRGLGQGRKRKLDAATVGAEAGQART